jgi:hypothetical protein
MSADTSVPRQRDASESAMADLMMLQAPVGLAFFGADSRFLRVNAAFTHALGSASDHAGLLPT